LLVLVIDDDELSRELLTLLLEVEGYGVQAAADGADALLRLKDPGLRPDAVLTDLQMPGISGAALAEELRSALPSGVPILAMSAADSRPVGNSAATPDGFDGFLLKPFSVADLRFALDIARGAERPEHLEGPTVESSTATPPADRIVHAAALNEEIFTKMSDLMPPAQLGQMFALCLADARTRTVAMVACARSGDDAAYRREAHAIKGGAGMIGAAEIHRLAGIAEEQGLHAPAVTSNGSTDLSAGITEVTALTEQLSRAYEQLERILGERLRP
jgi:CheY-like chemotaxis protein